jgi:RNA polymerase sigma factor (sigma-70 family)
MQAADAEDVTQIVLLRLVSYLPRFTYDPNQSFRGWLCTVTQNALNDFCQHRQRREAGSGDSRVADQLLSIKARDELTAKLAEEYDLELYEEAMRRVQLRVSPQKWTVFRLTALEGLSGAEVGQRLGLKVVTVYNIRSKILTQLQRERCKLEASWSGPAED